MARIASPIAVALAALAVDLQGGAPVDFRVIPAGEFRATDGRPTECTTWICTDEDGARLVAEATARQSDYVIDYEHQTLKAEQNGQPAPAAGWYKSLEWRPGDGLWIIGADWTALAASQVESKQYRYVSPVFSYDKKTGRVQKLFMCALTNNPGVDGLTDLAALSAVASLSLVPQPQESAMDELLEQLRWLLNMPVGATAEDVRAQLQKLIDQIKPADATAAASFSLDAHLASLSAQIVAAKSAAPDPAKYVEVAVLSATQAELNKTAATLASLQASIAEKEKDGVITEALTAGKLLPAQEAWAKTLDIASLRAFIDTAPVVAPVGTQTAPGGPGGSVDATDANAIAQAALKYQSEQESAGNPIKYELAVAHVTRQAGR